VRLLPLWLVLAYASPVVAHHRIDHIGGPAVDTLVRFAPDGHGHFWLVLGPLLLLILFGVVRTVLRQRRRD